MIERMMNGSPGRASSQELIDKVDEELALGRECLENIAKHQRDQEEEAVNREVASNTVGFIRVNGVEYPIVGFESTSAGFGRNGDDVLFQMTETEYSEGSYREPTLDAFSKIRPGYKGGNTPNLFKSCDPCSKVNPKDVAKRRAKNKAARRNKRK